MDDIDQPEFPFCQLSKKVQRKVCRCMKLIDLLGFTTCSKSIKNLVKSCGMKCEYFNVLHEEISFGCYPEQTIRFLDRDDPADVTSVMAFDGTGFGENDTETEWDLELTIRDWIIHFLEVFNREKPNDMHINTMHCNDDFTFECIQHNMLEFNVEQLFIESAEYTRQLLEFYPRVNYVVLGEHLPEGELRKLLIRNFDALNVFQKMSLDNVLLTNAAHLDIVRPMTPKEINRFLKLWIKGSNPRLKFFRVPSTQQDVDLAKEMILEGIDYQDQAEDFIFDAFEYQKESEEMVVSGGFEIRRKDGAEATVVIQEQEESYAFKMFVWN